MNIDRPKLRTTAFKSMSDFLSKLHIYKSMGDYEAAENFFNHYAEVDEEMLKVRQIVLDNKKPRRLELQPNLFLDSVTSNIVYKDYPDTFEGLIRSHIERFPDSFQADVWTQWCADKEFLKYKDS